MDFPQAVIDWLKNHEMMPILSAEKLEGGLISLTRRLVTARGNVVVKQCALPPEGLYVRESEGLHTLAIPNGLRIPEVLSVGEDHLILEDFGKREPGPGFWEDFGRRLAAMHACLNDRYGFHPDNYLGIILMDNAWSQDGWDFFARTRVLTFLEEPRCEEHLTSRDRQGVERLAAKLRQMIPFQPPSLLHGDLWTGNILVAPDGLPSAIDPSVYYGWPEAELSMTCAYDGVDSVAFDAYREVHPLEPGWEARFEILNIRELLSMIAHTGNAYGTVGKLRELLVKYA